MSVRGMLTKRMAEAVRARHGTHTDAARELGVSRPTLYAWLRGQEARGVNWRELVRLAGYSLPDNRDLIDTLTGQRIDWPSAPEKPEAD